MSKYLDKGVLGAVWLSLIVLVLVPLVFIVPAGLGLTDGNFLAPVVKFLNDERLPAVLRNTFLLATCVTIVSCILGVLFALAVERTSMRFAWLAHQMIMVPILVSPLVGAVAWVTLARPSTGFINVAWRTLTGSLDPLFSIYSFAGIALVISLHVAPYVYINVRNALQNIDGAMEEAAAILGSHTLTTWFRITIPLAMPAILSSALLVFVLTLETFSVVGLLGGPAGFVTLPFSIYLAINLPPGDWNYAAFEGLLLITITGLLMILYWKVIGASGQYAAIGGKGFRLVSKVGGKVQGMLVVVVWSYAVIAVVLPVAALLLQSFLGFTTSRFDNMIFTLANWQRLLDAPAFRLAFANTMIVGAVAATIAVVIGLFVSHFSIFERMRSLEWLAGLPLAYPGIVLGMAFIFTYNGTFIYGTLAILILAYVTQFLPFTTRALSAPVLQLDKGMDEAGKILGAYTMRRVMRITAPIVRSAVFSAWLIAFTRGIRELNVSIFLYTPATIVMPVLIWNYMEQGTFSQAAALSLLQLFAMLFLVAIAERLGRRFESV